jgi:D-citramalate synthase
VIALFRVFDTTLRDGEQTPGVSLKSEEKVRIAEQLDLLGVDVIEAGSVATSEGERDAIRRIVKEDLNAEICTFSRVLKDDLDLALSCDVDSVHLVVPVSDLHIKNKFHRDREFVIGRTVEVVEYAKDHGLIVELSGEDASRTDFNFLKMLFRKGISAGADRICFCDTVGVLIPERTAEIFGSLSEMNVPVSAHCHDDFGLATANSITALRSGATQVHVTVNGIGERAGNAALEEIVMILEELYRIDTGISKRELYKTSKLVSNLTKIPLSPNKSMVGDNAFTHESGIHVHAIRSDTSAYEPIPPEPIGRKRRIVFGKHTGGSSIKMVLEEFGLQADEEQSAEILNRVKDMGDKGKRVTDADIQAIAVKVLDIAKEEKVKLEDLTVVCGKKIMPTASIRLNVEGKDTIDAGIGIGPVDAAINALSKTISNDIRLEEYHVDAITGGTDALVEVSVKLSRGDEVISASGADADIIMASVEAFIQGINRLSWRKSNSSAEIER